MADAEYPDDVQFAGLVQAATAAADEQTRTSSNLGKRKRADRDDVSNIDPSMTGENRMNLNLQNSAAVLFREPSQKSKKYSRPPLGKVYTSLELAPETFLKLQSAGKDFMLDSEHPERRDVVGHRRHSGGTDVAKLKLWNCVEEFLREAGNGDKFFGPGAGEGIPDAPDRTMIWPEDSQKIIRACMPLMRKMVTNERQRVYAAQSRKPRTEQDGYEQGQMPQGQPIDESSLMDAATPEENGVEPSAPEQVNTQMAQARSLPQIPTGSSVVLLINLMALEGSTFRRIIPRFSVVPETAANLSSLRREVKKRAKGTNAKKIDSATIKVWMSDGLVQVKDDGEWMVALLSAGTVEWMDGEVRVLVEL
jgi:hypothetical protein